MSQSPKHAARGHEHTTDALAVRERGQRRLKKATTLTIAGALTITAITSALASHVATQHSHGASSTVASSPAAIAAAQQAAGTSYASNSGNAYNSGSSSSTPSSSQSAPVVSSGGS
jgi:hypothetical protein